MPAGQYLATGFMYLNLGCHMMFVLKNRLKAQGIPHDKTVKIIEDLVQGIFKSQLVRGVLAPQEPMAVSALREVFRKQALSSIMKLDAASMEKLIFLIVMTLKKEFFLASSPLQLFSVTRGNLTTLVQYVEHTSAASTMQNALELFTATGSALSFMQYHQLRQYVLSVMEPYQTKVVNFAEAGQQTDRGRLILLKRNAHNPALPNTLTLMPLADWRQWKTSLVIDHAREYERQSEQRHAKNQIGKEKSLNQLFGGITVESDFEVCLQLFDYEQQPPKNKSRPAKEQIKSSKETLKKNTGKSESLKIRKMIEQSFSGVGEEGEEEVDLLDVMDNS